MLAVSVAAPVIRWAGADPAFLSAGRLLLAAAVLWPVALFHGGNSFDRWRPEHFGLTVLSGLFLGAHFLFWITSLGLTSVASSVFLVTLHPVVTALLGRVLHGDRPSGRVWLSMGLSAAAALAIFGPDLARPAPATGPASARGIGDLLALLGGLSASAYFLVGRSVRRDCSTRAYAALSYTVAAAVATAALCLEHVPVRAQPASAWIAVAVMAVGPQLIGHTTFNWALRQLPAGPVAVATSGEPIAATALAWLFLGERPPWTLALAAPLAVAGICLASLAADEPPLPGMPAN